MQSVPAPPLVGRAPRRSWAAAGALAALVAVAAVAIAFATSSPAPPPAAPAAKAYDGLIGGVPLQSARCVQWNAGSAAERDRVVGALAYSVGGASTGRAGGVGTTLPPAQAHSLFDRACSSQIAQHWLLYELYIRAAGFSSYVPR